MSASDLPAPLEQKDYASRREFLYKVVEDTQNTIRFLDTKAAFCVTLLSGMVAGTIEGVHSSRSPAHAVFFTVFMVAVALSLVVCLLVIFPVIKPPSALASHTARSLPKFFIPHKRSHHWLRHTFSSSVDNVLCEDYASYTATLRGAGDEDLFLAMCDEVLLISLIRQIKSDRLHTAMFALLGTVVLFAAVMLT